MDVHSAVFGGSQGNCRLAPFPLPRRAPRAACRLLPLPPLRSPESQLTPVPTWNYPQRETRVASVSPPKRYCLNRSATTASEGCASHLHSRQFSKIGPSTRFLTFDPSAYSRPLCAFTLLCQNEFKSAISERIRKCTPGRGVAPHATELGAISQ